MSETKSKTQYTNLKYNISDAVNNVHPVMISVDEKSGYINHNKLTDAFKYLNNILLENKIHLDFGKVREYAGFQKMADSMSKIDSDKGDALIFNMMKDIDAFNTNIPVVGPAITYYLEGTIKGSREEIEKRLKQNFKYDLF